MSWQLPGIIFYTEVAVGDAAGMPEDGGHTEHR